MQVRLANAVKTNFTSQLQQHLCEIVMAKSCLVAAVLCTRMEVVGVEVEGGLIGAGAELVMKRIRGKETEAMANSEMHSSIWHAVVWFGRNDCHPCACVGCVVGCEERSSRV